MAKVENQLITQSIPRVVLTAAQVAENANYIENWAMKHAVQIDAHNEMIEKDGMWNDGFRLF